MAKMKMEKGIENHQPDMDFGRKLFDIFYIVSAILSTLISIVVNYCEFHGMAYYTNFLTYLGYFPEIVFIGKIDGLCLKYIAISNAFMLLLTIMFFMFCYRSYSVYVSYNRYNVYKSIKIIPIIYIMRYTALLEFRSLLLSSENKVAAEKIMPDLAYNLFPSLNVFGAAVIIAVCVSLTVEDK